MRFFNIMFIFAFSFLFCFSAASSKYTAVWSCGKSLDDLFWTINSNGEITKDDNDDDIEELYGLIAGLSAGGKESYKIELISIRMTDENGDRIKDEKGFETASYIMEQMQWKKIGNNNVFDSNTYIGNGVISLAEQAFAITFSINDDQSVSTVLSFKRKARGIGTTDAVEMIGIGIDICERLQ